jgi:hypothetical protein
MYIVYLQQENATCPMLSNGAGVILLVRVAALPFIVLFVQLSLLYSASPLQKNTTPPEG